MSQIFDIVSLLLQLISLITGLTYKEINVIVYYGVIPFLYCVLIGRIFQKYYLKVIFCIGSAIFLLCTKDFRGFSEWLFNQSVIFLLGFGKFGWDYVTASVIICVIVPGMIFVFLFYCAYKPKSNKQLKDGSVEKSKKPMTAFRRIIITSVRVVGVLLLLVLVMFKGCQMYFSPRFQHFKYERQEKQNLLRLLGPYGQQINNLNCKCYACSDFSETENRICRFKASRNVMSNIKDHLRLQERRLTEWEQNHIDIYQKEGFSYKAGVSNNFSCMQYAPFTAIFTNPKKPYGGLTDIFYNENSEDACIAFQQYGFG